MNNDLLERMAIRPEIRAMRDELVRVRRDLHRHPELGHHEERTAAVVAEALQAAGLEVTQGVAGTGVVGLLRGSRPGPTVLVRADMDALPLEEESLVPYASTVCGRMHACGHDGHVAIALGTAGILARMRERLPGNVKFAFQPAEEGPGGAQPMIEAGILHHPEVDCCLGLHLWNELPLGHVGVLAGSIMASSDEFTLTVCGRGGHGAQPQRVVDPVVASAHVIVALQTIASRRVDPLQSVVVTVGAIHAGQACNIIPERVEMRGTVRAMDPDLRERLPAMFEDVVRGVTSALGATYELDYTQGYPVVVNAPAITDLVRTCANAVVGSAGRVVPCQTMGSEDMAFFLRAVPGCFFFLGSANPERGLHHPHHSPRFDFDEDALPLGVEIMTRAVEATLHHATDDSTRHTGD